MKILEFRAENIKRLRVVEIKPNGEVITIAGRNGQGKSSTLDAIWWALAGTSAIQAQPIRKGETKARIRLALGDGETVELIVERRFTEKSSSLHVERADGSRLMTPQKVLDALTGALAFDPQAFARMEPRKQFDELRRLVDLTVDIDQLDLLNNSDYQKRTDINRDAKAKRAAADAISVPAGLPTEPIDENEILNRIQTVAARNADIEKRKARRAEVARKIKAYQDEIPNHERRIEELEAEILVERKAISHAQAQAHELATQLATADPLPEPGSVVELRAELDRAKVLNHGVGRLQERERIAAEATALEQQAAELTEQMAARTKAKADAIAAAKMPVPGLGFGDGIVTLNGVPFDQASTAEQLRTSMAIAMAANPKLRIIRIQHGNDLDADNLKLIASMAKDNDYQVWLERVDSSSKVGIVIEDGSVVAVDGQPVAKAVA